MREGSQLPFPVVTASPGHTLAAGTFPDPAAPTTGSASKGDLKYGLNEVKIGLTMPQYVIEMARQRLTPAEFSRAIVTGRIYTPEEAAAAGFIDTVVSAGDFESACAEATAEMETLNVEAHAATAPCPGLHHRRASARRSKRRSRSTCPPGARLPDSGAGAEWHTGRLARRRMQPHRIQPELRAIPDLQHR